MNLERVQLGLLAATAATGLVSIFAAQLFLTLAVVVYVVRLAKGRATVQRLPVDGPILAFTVWTLLSASFSPNPMISYDNAKKLVLFALLYVAADSLPEEADRERVLDASILGGLALAGYSILQFYFLGYDTLNNRPPSFLEHYMTSSGLAMTVLILAVARLTLSGRAWTPPSRGDVVRGLGLATILALLVVVHRVDLFALEAKRLFVAALAAAAVNLVLSRSAWPGPTTSTALTSLAVPVCAWALLLSRTRNAWLGAVVGLAAVIVLRAPRALWLLPFGLAAVLIVMPRPVAERLTWTDASSRDRYYMWQAGIDMIRDKPVFGQGPGMILGTYPEYRWPGAPNPVTPHLHDNALQIAAERGLPCLAWWLWLVVAVLADGWREARGRLPGPAWASGATLAVFAAVLAGGLFEYNFGDSEILMFLLLISALPYALRRERASRAVAA